MMIIIVIQIAKLLEIIYYTQFLVLEPPSECTDLQVLSTTDTTITVSWSRPETIGRSDYFYMVSHSDPSNLGELITVEEELVDSGSTVTYTVTGLLPFTPYMVLVSNQNGVSAQDPNSANSRQCDNTTMTMEGGKCHL